LRWRSRRVDSGGWCCYRARASAASIKMVVVWLSATNVSKLQVAPQLTSEASNQAETFHMPALPARTSSGRARADLLTLDESTYPGRPAEHCCTPRHVQTSRDRRTRNSDLADTLANVHPSSLPFAFPQHIPTPTCPAG
jgi:hypothetical protein